MMKCGFCSRDLPNKYAVAGICEADSCEEPLCALCWRHHSRFCREHSGGKSSFVPEENILTSESGGNDFATAIECNLRTLCEGNPKKALGGIIRGLSKAKGNRWERVAEQSDIGESRAGIFGWKVCFEGSRFMLSAAVRRGSLSAGSEPDAGMLRDCLRVWRNNHREPLGQMLSVLFSAGGWDDRCKPLATRDMWTTHACPSRNSKKRWRFVIPETSPSTNTAAKLAEVLDPNPLDKRVSEVSNWVRDELAGQKALGAEQIARSCNVRVPLTELAVLELSADSQFRMFNLEDGRLAIRLK